MQRIICFIVSCLTVSACTYNLSAWLPPPRAELGDAARGGEIFHHGSNDVPPCSSCHQTVLGATGFALGPNLADVNDRAAHRVAGLTAAAYLRQSILDPHAFVVPGFRDIMYAQYAEYLTPQAVNDLVAYLESL